MRSLTLAFLIQYLRYCMNKWIIVNFNAKKSIRDYVLCALFIYTKQFWGKFIIVSELF